MRRLALAVAGIDGDGEDREMWDKFYHNSNPPEIDMRSGCCV